MGETGTNNLEELFSLMWINSSVKLPIGAGRREMHNLIKLQVGGVTTFPDLDSQYCEGSS